MKTDKTGSPARENGYIRKQPMGYYSFAYVLAVAISALC